MNTMCRKLAASIWCSVAVVASFMFTGSIQVKATAFVPDSYGSKSFRNRFHNTKRGRTTDECAFSSELRGIGEWRDTVFDIPGETRPLGIDDCAVPRQICVLPFPVDDVLLQGETKQLRLYEDRFIKLFDTTMGKHHGVVGMGLIADSGIIQTVPLCEVEAYNRMEEFGIFVTIRVVGRGTLLELSQQEPYLKATCIEVIDKIPQNLDLPNMVADNIENYYMSLSDLDTKLEKKHSALSNKGEELHYDENNDDEEEEEDQDPYGQFNKAFRQAKASDTQGYMVSEISSVGQRNAQDLTAVSWSAFCTDGVDIMARLQALDCDDLFDRLKMGSYMLREQKAELEAKLALSDVQVLEEDEDDHA